MQEYIEKFFNHLEVERNLSPNTIKAYYHDLRGFLFYLESLIKGKTTVIILSKMLIKDYLTYLAKERNNGVSVRARKIAALKSFFGYLFNEGLVEYNPTKDIRTPRIPKKEPLFLSEQECVLLLKVVRERSSFLFRRRDLAILTTFLGMGLRLSELVTLNVANVNFKLKTMKITRKGRKEQLLPLSDPVLNVLKDYLEDRKNSLNTALFLSRRDERLSKRQIQRIIQIYLNLAGLKHEKVSVHTLRHSFASNLIAKNGSIIAIQKLMGHTSIKTTERYLHVTAQQLLQEVNKLNFEAIA